LDLRVMAARQRAWSADVDALGSRLVVLQEEEAALHDEIARARGISSEARTARAANAERLRAVEAAITAARVAGSEAQARATSLAARANDFSARAEESARESERLAGRMQQLGAEAVAARAEVDRLAAELPAAEEAQRLADARLGDLVAAG